MGLSTSIWVVTINNGCYHEHMDVKVDLIPRSGPSKAEIPQRLVRPPLEVVDPLKATPITSTPLSKDILIGTSAKPGPDDRFTSVAQVLKQMETDDRLREDVERWRESYRRGGPMRNGIFKFDDIFREIISEGKIKAPPPQE